MLASLYKSIAFQLLILRYLDLSSGVDVYSDWIDACDAVAKEAAHTTGDAEGSTQYQSHAAPPDLSRHSIVQQGRHMPILGEGRDDNLEGYQEDDA